MVIWTDGLPHLSGLPSSVLSPPPCKHALRCLLSVPFFSYLIIYLLSFHAAVQMKLI